MGTFVGHSVPGLSLMLLGLWHTINTIKLYFQKGPNDFIIQFWHPFPRFKHLELVLIFILSLLANSLQILDYPSFRFTFKTDNFEHAAMFLQLAIFAGFVLSSELTRSSSDDIFSGVIGILVSSVFGQELFLLHFHSADHIGLEGHYHFLLQLIVSISFASAIASTLNPRIFSAALVLTISVLFQGCWFLNMGFNLWVPKFVPKGCVSTASASDKGGGFHSAVVCESPAADSRARAIANLQFSWIFSGILIFTATLCVKFSAKNVSSRCRLTEYEQIHGRSGDNAMAIDEFGKPEP